MLSLGGYIRFANPFMQYYNTDVQVSINQNSVRITNSLSVHNCFLLLCFLALSFSSFPEPSFTCLLSRRVFSRCLYLSFPYSLSCRLLIIVGTSSVVIFSMKSVISFSTSPHQFSCHVSDELRDHFPHKSASVQLSFGCSNKLVFTCSFLNLRFPLREFQFLLLCHGICLASVS